jgi:hypothetical protein
MGELLERLLHPLEVIERSCVAPDGRLDAVQLLERVESQLQRIDVGIHRLPRLGLLQKTTPLLPLGKGFGSIREGLLRSSPPILPKADDLLIIAISVSLQCRSLGALKAPASALILDIAEGTTGADISYWLNRHWHPLCESITAEAPAVGSIRPTGASTSSGRAHWRTWKASGRLNYLPLPPVEGKLPGFGTGPDGFGCGKGTLMGLGWDGFGVPFGIFLFTSPS